LAAISFWALWIAPLVIGLGFGRLVMVIWATSPNETLGWGSLGYWGLMIGIGGCPGALLFFLMISLRYPGIWKETPRMRAVPSGILLSEGEAPELFAVLARAKRRAVLESPVEVRVELGAHSRCLVYKPHRGPRQRAIVAGLPEMAALSPGQLELALGYNAALLALPSKLLELVVLTRSFASPRSPVNYFGVCERVCNLALKATHEHALRLAGRDGGNAEQVLQKAGTAATEFQNFWSQHVQLVLQTGHLVPVLDGFQQYWKARQDPDTTPELSALSLLRSPSALESRLQSAIIHANPGIEMVSWTQVATVLLQSRVGEVEKRASHLKAATVRDIPQLFGNDGTRFGRAVFHEPGRLYHPNQLLAMAAHLLSAAFAVALSRDGWKFLYCGPGSSLAFGKNGTTIEPFALVNGLLSKDTKPDEWRSLSANREIADLALA
jgi:hypothetical protein